MMLQTGLKKSINILPNISKSKGNHLIKLGQLLENSVRNMKQKMLERDYFQTSLCFFFQYASCEVKASSQQFSFKIFW